jgi:membrane protein required for beta-lactamase induction
MTFVVALLALFLERVLIEQDDWRSAPWFPRYLRWLRSLPYGTRLTEGALGVIVVLLPPLGLVALIQAWLGDSLAGVPDLVFGTAVLLYCLGPQSLDAQARDFTEALEDGEPHCDEIARGILGDEPPTRLAALLEAVIRAIPAQALQRIFSVLFWFLILGPLGALLYRLARHLEAHARVHGELEDSFRAAAVRLPFILDWVPARLTTASYALAGSFDDVLSAWRKAAAARVPPSELAERAGAAALRLEDAAPVPDDARELIERAIGLVWRSVVIWLGLLGLATVAYWAS